MYKAITIAGLSALLIGCSGQTQSMTPAAGSSFEHPIKFSDEDIKNNQETMAVEIAVSAADVQQCKKTKEAFLAYSPSVSKQWTSGGNEDQKKRAETQIVQFARTYAPSIGADRVKAVGNIEIGGGLLRYGPFGNEYNQVVSFYKCTNA